MMTWQVPLSTNSEIILSGDDDLYVASNVLLANDLAGVASSSGSHWLRIYGSVVTSIGSPILLIGNSNDSSSTMIDLYKGSHVEALASNAVALISGSNTVNNFGTINASGVGIAFSDSGVSQTEAVDNHGSIVSHALQATSIPLVGIGRDCTATIKLTNEGMIKGDDAAYETLGSHQGVDKIVNKGTMIGMIDLQDGNDSFDGRLGITKGDILGGNGADKLLAGAGQNVIDGGAGADKISGGAGGDKLTGGADADTFLFFAVTDSTAVGNGCDTILDFHTAEHDKISLKAIDANTQAPGDQAFHFIDANGFHGHAGELRYETSGGNAFVYADIDGDGKADFGIELDGVSALGKHDFAF